MNVHKPARMTVRGRSRPSAACCAGSSPATAAGAPPGWEYLQVAIDALRLADTERLPDEGGPSCAGLLARAAAWFASLGVRIERVLTDHAFASTHGRAFQATLAERGARHLTPRPDRPRTHGKLERFIQTALREWLGGRPYASSAERTNRHHAGLAALVQPPPPPRQVLAGGLP